MVQDPAEYRWSSYRHHALGEPNELIRGHELFVALGRDASERQRVYRALFRTQLDEEAIADIRKAISQGLVLGNERFREEIERALGKCINAKPRGRPKGRGEGGIAGEQIGFEF